MPAFRVTQSTVSATMLAGLQANLDRMQAVQGRLSSGKQISRPSDSPSGTLDAMRHRAALRRLEQHGRNAQDGLAWLGTADQALTSSLDVLRRARELAVAAGNAALGPEAREALATEIDGIRSTLLGLANTRYGDRPVFSGTAAVTQAYDPSGAYLGDAGVVERTVGDGARVTVNLTGPDVFGPPSGGGGSVFDALAAMSAHLRSSDPTQIALASSSDLSAIDGWRTNISDRLSMVGARYNRIETLRTRAEDAAVTVTERLSEVEDIDLPKTIMELELQEVAYKAALAAAARVVQPSLVDFLA